MSHGGVNPKVDQAKADRARVMAEKLLDAASRDFADLSSCINLAADSTRPDFLEACVEEYLKGFTAKVRLATSLCCKIAESVPASQDVVQTGRLRSL